MTLYVPVGIPGSGKSTLGKYWFKSSEIVSPDTFREMLTDNVMDQSANATVFDLAHKVTEYRLRRGRDVYFDATNLDPGKWPDPQGHELICIVMETSIRECYQRNLARERMVPVHAMEKMAAAFLRLPASLPIEQSMYSTYFDRKRGF